MEKTNKLSNWLNVIIAEYKREGKYEFIPRNAEPNLNNEVTRLRDGISALQHLLTEHGEGTLAQAVEYQRKGAYFKRDLELEKARGFLPQFPAFWHERLMEDALNAIDTKYYDDISSALTRCDCTIERDVIESSDGSWQPTAERINRIKQSYIYHATAEDISIVKLFADLLKTMERLHALNVFVNDDYSRGDFATDIECLPINSPQEAIEMILDYRRPTEAEINQLRQQYGVRMH